MSISVPSSGISLLLTFYFAYTRYPYTIEQAIYRFKVV